MKLKDTRILATVCNEFGRYIEGTIILVKGTPYVLEPGHCGSCDLHGDSCFDKPLSCDQDVAEHVCFKSKKGGL